MPSRPALVVLTLLAIAACTGGGEVSPSPSLTATPTAQPTPGGRGCPEPTAEAASPDPEDLTGAWRADDGGTYYLRQVEDCLWWAGLSGGGSGQEFTNVAVGRITGEVIELEWADVPRGRILGGGSLTLRMEGSPPDRLTKEAETGTGFAAETWTRLSPTGPEESPGGDEDEGESPSPAGPGATASPSPSPAGTAADPSPSPSP